jgi:hypothetical protein
MKIKPIYFLLCLILFTKVIQAKDKNDSPQQGKSIRFTENKGQFADQNYIPRPDVLFGGSDGQLTFHITKKGISYQLYRVDSYKEVEDPKTKENRKTIDQQSIYRTDIKWLNTNPNPLVKTDEALFGYSNYYLEQCPNGALNVKNYKGITLQNIYNNIDLHYYEKDGQLKYDYIVDANTDYKQIQLKVEGASLKLQEDGSILIETPLGKIQEQAPLVYQNGAQLVAHYTIKNNTIGFEVENYNRDLELIIDPVIRLWGTYYGGTGDESGYSNCKDGAGNVYMSGSTLGSNGTLIATSGSHQTAYASSGSNDAFLVKFNSNGARLWGTYYGASLDDYGLSCTTDASGDVFMAGYTYSTNGTTFATTGAHQTAHGGLSDAFLVKFSSAGVRLWGTYYGGSATDVGRYCAVDNSGNVYLSGYSNNNTGTVIATSGSHQSSMGGGFDGFLVKFNSNGTRLWGTYYGGTGDEFGHSCATDVSGNIFMAGYTASNSIGGVATSGSHQNANNGSYDSFLVKFNGNGARQWGTYYGGSGNEGNCYCNVDVAGNVYLTGYTTSNTGTAVATVAGHQNTLGGSYDAYLVQFNSSGVRQWGTYYGGTGDEYGYGCTTDVYGNVFIVGYTTSGTGTSIATAGNYQSTYGGGADGYLVKFSNSGARLWGTYYGGTNGDAVTSCIIDASGDLVVSGGTSSTLQIATAVSHQSTISGYNDAFLVKFHDCTSAVSSVNGPVCLGGTLSLITSLSNTSSPSYSWTGPNSFTAAVKNPTIGSLSSAYAGIYTLTINDGLCIETSTTQVYVVNPLPTITVNSGSICSGNSFVIVPSGANMYTITNGNFTVSPNVTSSYSVSGTSSAGCISFDVVSTVTVYTIPIPTLTVNSGSICSGNSFTIAPNGANTYTITGGNFTVSPNTTTSYSVTGTSTAGCVSSNIVSNVTVFATPTIAVNSGSICSGSSFTIIPSGANSYSITGGNYTVSPITTSSYSLIGASNDGCVSSNAVSTIMVYTTPTLAVNSGSICSGNSFTILPNGANTYSVTGGSLVVSPNTTFTYSVIGASNAGCVSSHVLSTVTVQPTPNVTVNSGSICSGNTITIVPSGANSYSITGNAFTVNPGITTSYSVTGSSTAGCVSNNAISTITVNATPTISVNSGSLCIGNSFIIAPSGANTYTITGGNYTVSPVISTSYSITGTSAVGCISSGYAVSTVTVNTTPTVSVNSGSICSGNSFIITTNGANTYTITGGNFTVSPGITSSYSVTGTNTEGCISSYAVSNVTVHSTPTLAVNSGSICSGNSFTIIPSGANSYTISGGNHTVSPVATTSYSVTGASTEGCVSFSDAVCTVTVNTTPTVSVNSGSICSGNSFIITPSGADTYSITGGTFTVSPTITTSYSVMGTSAEGCLSLKAISDITVYATPSLAVNSGSICSGSNFIIVPSGANTYSITGGNYTVNPITTTSYSVSGSSIEGCVSANAVSSVTVYATPTLVTNSGSICLGENFVITPSGANTYTISGGTFTVSPITNTSYSVIGMSSEGCISGEEQSSLVVDVCTGLNEISRTNNESVKIYPNPSYGLLHIESIHEAEVFVIDLQGRLVFKCNVRNGANLISIEGISSGVYFIEISHPTGKQAFRVIKY